MYNTNLNGLQIEKVVVRRSEMKVKIVANAEEAGLSIFHHNAMDPYYNNF